MLRFKQILVFLIPFLFGTLAHELAVAQQQIHSAAEVEPAERLHDIRRLAMEQLEKRGAPSVVVGVAEGEEVLWLEAFGWADLETQRPATPKTSYAVGSLSKSVTATAVFALISQGRLNFDTPIAELIGGENRLTGLGGSIDRVQVEHLLNSNAGIPHGYVSHSVSSGPPNDLYKWHQGFICFPPGEVFEYSNNSFGALQRVIEEVTGQTFGDALQKLVFEPLGMTGSLAGFCSDRSSEFATPHDRDGSAISRFHNQPEGGLGLYCTAHDLLRFGMFHAGTLETEQCPPVTDNLLNQMHDFGKELGTGYFHLGWWSSGKDVIVSNGSIRGANANLTIALKEKLVVVVLTNQTSSLADELSNQIVAQFDPTIVEASKQARIEYHRRFRTPYAAHNEWLGTWRGVIVTPETEVPLELSLDESAASLRIGDGPQVVINDPSLNELDEFRGSISGRIPGVSPEDNSEQRITLMLRLIDERLYGYTSTIFQTRDGGFSLPAYVCLAPQR